MNPTHRKHIHHGDPELAQRRVHRRKKAEPPPSEEGPALVIKDRRTAAFMPTELAKAPELPGAKAKSAIKVIEKRASAGVEDPKEPVPAPAVAPAEAAADAAANAGSPVAAPTAPVSSPSAPAIAVAVAASGEAPGPSPDEGETPQDGGAPAAEEAVKNKKNGRGMGAVDGAVDFATTNLLAKAKAAGGISAGGAVLYQVIDNSIELAGGRAAGDALLGIITDITSGFWDAIRWAGEKVSSSPAWAAFAGVGVAGIWLYKNVRDFRRSWKGISVSEKPGYYKTWDRINEAFSLAWRLAKTAFASLFICHLPSIVAHGAEIAETQKGMGFFDNIRHGIDMFFRHAPAAASALFALAGIGVLWLTVSAGFRKLTDMHQASKEEKAEKENLSRQIEEQLALRAREEAGAGTEAEKRAYIDGLIARLRAEQSAPGKTEPPEASAKA